MRINLPAGGHPIAVAFADDATSVIVASQGLAGSSLYMYGEEKPKASGETKQQPKLPLPEIKWEQHKVHDKKSVLTLVGATASYGSADGSTIVASCSEGTLTFTMQQPSTWHMNNVILSFIRLYHLLKLFFFGDLKTTSWLWFFRSLSIHCYRVECAPCQTMNSGTSEGYFKLAMVSMSINKISKKTLFCLCAKS